MKDGKSIKELLNTKNGKIALFIPICILLILHIFWPKLGIDSVSIVLLIVLWIIATSPQIGSIGSILKNLAASGLRNVEGLGFKITLEDVQSAAEKITPAALKVNVKETLSIKDNLKSSRMLKKSLI